MTCPTYADELPLLTIPYTERQVRPVLQVLNVVDNDSLSMPTLRLAGLAFVAVKLEHLRSHVLPIRFIVPDIFPAL